MSSAGDSPAAAVGKGPQRERGRQRVEALLAAAAQVFATQGYAATTMTAIAAGASSSIGSLYQFFPTKEAVVQALLLQQTEDLFVLLDALRERTAQVDLATLACELCAALVAFRAAHPSFAVLVEDSAGATGPLAAEVRARVRRWVIETLAPRATAAGLSRQRLAAVAAVVQQAMKAANQLKADELPGSGAPALKELALMLRCYLEVALKPVG
jgi:AcrR family transcriptional regulator